MFEVHSYDKYGHIGFETVKHYDEALRLIKELEQQDHNEGILGVWYEIHSQGVDEQGATLENEDEAAFFDMEDEWLT